MRQQALAAAFAFALGALIAAGPVLAAPKHPAAKSSAAPKRPATKAQAAAPTPDASAAPEAGDAAPATPVPADAPVGESAAPAAEAVPAGDATTDMRCIVVAGALLQSDDEQVKSLGRASLFYYIGRLQGRGDVANLDARILAQADKMTEDDFKTESKTCSGLFTGAAQALQDVSGAFEKHFAPPGGRAGAAPKR
jgi:hypothetical protein